MKKIVTIIIALVMCAMPMSALANQLTEVGSSSMTEVKAHVVANVGEVSYVITIPDEINFGELSQPANENADSYKDVEYEIEASTISDLPEGKQISVYVKDENAIKGGDESFHITNKIDSEVSFEYSIFADENCTQDVGEGNMTAAGFFLTGFTTAGQSMKGKLRFNQTQLLSKSIVDIIGEYSGHIVSLKM